MKTDSTEEASAEVAVDGMLETIFLNARSQNGFEDRPVAESLIHQLYDLVKMGPTSMNCLPARFLFVRSEERKSKLVECMAPPNQNKVAAAPVSVIIGMDLDFVETLPKNFPHMDVRPLYVGNEELIRDTAFRNSSLQGAYLIMAARGLGLDCGPMSGFDANAVDEAFWKGTNVRTNFVCTIGYGDPSKLFPRHPRPAFSDVCSFV